MEVQNLYIGDNLPIMLRMESDTVDLIYTDPPFNSNTFRKGKTEAHSFDDTWSKAEVDYAHAVNLKFQYPHMWQMIVLTEKMHSKSMHNYLAFMAPRLVQMHRLLKPTGSLYLHCDASANYYLRVLLDCIFGGRNFRNEIVWCYTGPSAAKKNFPAKSDTIFRYTKTGAWTFNEDAIRIPYKKLTYQHREEQDSGIGGKLTLENIEEYQNRGKMPENWWSDISPVGRIKSERTGYQTQKPLGLTDRVIKASSNDGDLILDPFCGCATACVSASGLRRQWVGIDQNKKAVEILRDRLTQRLDTFGFKTNMPTDAQIEKVELPKKRKPTGYQKISIKQAKLNLVQADYQKHGVTFCKGCFTELESKFLHVDHILAKANGGLDELSNLQLLCQPCNSKKGSKDMQFLYRVLDDEIRQKRMKLSG